MCPTIFPSVIVSHAQSSFPAVTQQHLASVSRPCCRLVATVSGHGLEKWGEYAVFELSLHFVALVFVLYSSYSNYYK